MSNEWGFPTIQYGYIHIDPASLGVDVQGMSAYDLGIQYMIHLNLFMQGMEAGKKIDVVPNQELNSPFEEALKKELGDTKDLTYEKNIENLPHEDAQKLISEGLGESAPWESDVKADPKPWEKAPAKAPLKKITTVKTPTVKDLF
jgi:hypothetical protein